MPDPADGNGRGSLGGEPQVTLGVVERSLVQLAGGQQRRQLGVGGQHANGEPGQQLVRGGRLAIEYEAEPVIKQQAGRQVPVLRGLGMADRVDRETVLREPAGGRAVQPGQLFLLRGIKQLKLQQVGEQGMVTEPGPLRVQCDHERVRLFQLAQDPPAAGATGEQVRELAVHAP